MKIQFAFTAIICLIALGCSEKSQAKKSNRNGLPVVVATNAPLHYIARQLAGNQIEVSFPVPSDVDPADWQPTADEILAMQRADLILANGATYEKWMGNASLPESKIVNTSSAFKDNWIETADGIVHSHGPDGAHSHIGTAFTTWIDFNQALQQANAVRESLLKLAPHAAETINGNFKNLEYDLKLLDEQMAIAAKSIGNQPLIVSHPVYQYWTRRYMLNTHSVHLEPAEVPATAELEKLKKLLVDHPAKFIIWEGQPSDENVKLMQGMGLTSVVFAPYANRPDKLDWQRQMQVNIANLKVIFEPTN